MIPPRTILAPVDFSDASRVSLEHAARLAARWRALLHVMHAIDPLLAAAAGTRHLDLAATTHDELTAFATSAAGTSAVEYHVTVGAAAESICRTAEALGADLIVAGTRGLTGLNRLVMGTTTEHVIRRSTRPVLTVPGHPASVDVSYGPVIAALERPDAPGLVAPAAAALAASLDAPFHVVHVVPPLAAAARWRSEADAVLQARIDDARRTLIAAMGELGGPPPANVHVTTGPVADTLAAEVSRYSGSVAVLVLGRDEPGSGHAPGSVASRVIARATAPVWVHLPDA